MSDICHFENAFRDDRFFYMLASAGASLSFQRLGGLIIPTQDYFVTHKLLYFHEIFIPFQCIQIIWSIMEAYLTTIQKYCSYCCLKLGVANSIYLQIQ